MAYTYFKQCVSVNQQYWNWRFDGGENVNCGLLVTSKPCRLLGVLQRFWGTYCLCSQVWRWWQRLHKWFLTFGGIQSFPVLNVESDRRLPNFLKNIPLRSLTPKIGAPGFSGMLTVTSETTLCLKRPCTELANNSSLPNSHIFFL